MSSISFQRAFARFHLGVYERTGGRVGHGLSGNTALVLTTIGRRSGERRRTVLVYARDGEDLVVVASNYGGERPPAWLLNLREQPRVEVLLGRRRASATARELTPEEAGHAALWRLVNAGNRDRYDGHQHETTRPISLVVITPDTAAGSA